MWCSLPQSWSCSIWMTNTLEVTGRRAYKRYESYNTWCSFSARSLCVYVCAWVCLHVRICVCVYLRVFVGALQNVSISLGMNMFKKCIQLFQFLGVWVESNRIHCLSASMCACILVCVCVSDSTLQSYRETLQNPLAVPQEKQLKFCMTYHITYIQLGKGLLCLSRRTNKE